MTIERDWFLLLEPTNQRRALTRRQLSNVLLNAAIFSISRQNRRRNKTKVLRLQFDLSETKFIFVEIYRIRIEVFQWENVRQRSYAWKNARHQAQ